MAIFNSAGSGNANADATWTESGQPAAGDHAIIASGHTVTLTADEAWGSCRVNGTLAGNYTVTLNDGGNSAILHNDGTINDTPNFTITGGTNREIKNDGSSTLGTVTINSSGQTFTLAGPNTHTWEALTITAGTLTTLDGSTNRNLTVTGDVSVTGTLTGNASAISMGSLLLNSGGTYSATSGTTTITSEAGTGYAIKIQGSSTFTHNNGTVTVTTPAATLIKITENNIYNYIMNASGQSHEWVDNTITANDLTITAGTFQPYNDSYTIDVNGDVLISSGGTLGKTAAVQAFEFGSLTIASGGTYIATSGTTTITGEKSGGFAIQNSGTFTHNKGLVDIDFTSPTTTMASNGPYWDFTQSDAATDFYTEAVFEVMNNLYFVGDFDFQNNSHHLIVHGNMTIGNGTTTTRYKPYGTYTCNLTVHGILEVTNGATLTNFTHGTINVGGVRNTGGTM